MIKGILVVAVGFLLLPGSVIVLLASNFGALKGYLIGAVSFFGFLAILSFIWAFGLPGTPPLTGPKGTLPSFKEFTLEDPIAHQRFTKAESFTGQATGDWRPAPGQDGQPVPPEQEALKAELDAAAQAATARLIREHNQNVTDSSQELDVTNLQTTTYYTTQDGTELAAIVISPKDPPPGSGLERPDIEPVTFFAYRDPGNPRLPSLLFLGGSIVLFVLHVLALARVERRRPLGWKPQPAQAVERPAARV